MKDREKAGSRQKSEVGSQETEVKTFKLKRSREQAEVEFVVKGLEREAGSRKSGVRDGSREL